MTWTGCRKDDLKINDPGTESHLSLRFRFMHGAQPFSMDSVYTDGFGSSVRFTAVRFLLHGFTPLQEQGFEQGAWPEAWCLADASSPNTEWPLGIVKTGSIHFLRTTTGLSSEQDRLLPEQCPCPAAMHAMLTDTLGSGYDVLVLEGRVDSDGDGNVSDDDQLFRIRCASNDYKTPLMIHAHADVFLLRDAVLDVRVDMAKLLKDIDLPDGPVAIGDGPVDDQAMNNLTQGALGEP